MEAMHSKRAEAGRAGRQPTAHRWKGEGGVCGRRKVQGTGRTISNMLKSCTVLLKYKTMDHSTKKKQVPAEQINK